MVDFGWAARSALYRALQCSRNCSSAQAAKRP
jgi:hypothetical protein